MRFHPGRSIRSVETGGLDLVLLDSSVPGKPHGELDAPTLQWLETTLASCAGPAGAVVPAPSAVHDRHLAHGPPESPQCRRTRADRPASSARAADRHRSRSSRDADDVRGRAGHDLPRAQSRGRSRSRTVAARRRSRSNRRRFISTAGFRGRGSAASSPIKSRSAISTGRIRFSDRTGSCCSRHETSGLGFLRSEQPRRVAAEDGRLLLVGERGGGEDMVDRMLLPGIGWSVPSMIWLAPTCATRCRRPSGVNTMASK